MKLALAHRLHVTCIITLNNMLYLHNKLLRLQQRRTREQLADQGIMPLHVRLKLRSTEEFEKKKKKKIIQYGSSLEAQMRLKRARLAEDLNEKLALRPGPLELVQKNIIPLDSAVSMTGIGGETPRCGVTPP
uniref:Phosphatase and actin regulator n=1 Tax=Salarias fasciatus TaxID=181472 RepID=A0A672F235_SALFA